MPAIPMTSDTEISLPSSSFSKLKRSPYLSSMCVDDNGCHETTATTSSPRHASIHRHRHRHMPRPTSSYVSDLFELLRPATARHDATASATFHPYLLPEDGEDGDSCPSSAASTEIIDNRLREGGGKITMRRAKRGGTSAAVGNKKSLSSSSATAPSSSSPSASNLRYYYPQPFSRVNALLSDAVVSVDAIAIDASAATAAATSKRENSPLSSAFDRIRIDTSTSSASSVPSISSRTSGSDNSTNPKRSHDEIANWIRQHYNPSRGNFFRKVLDPMDGPSGDLNKKVRNELWKEILLLDDDDDDNDSSLASEGEDANVPRRYPNRPNRRRRISNNSISNDNSRINLSSSFPSASRISFSSLSSVASSHSPPVLSTGSGVVVADPDSHHSTNDGDDDGIVPDTPDTREKNALLLPASFPRSRTRNGARVAPVPATPTAKRRSASHAGLAYGTEYCREGHDSFASLSGSFSSLASTRNAFASRRRMDV
mmetsp:Transcript_17682/g.35443  ORF Transcript_17682/g.35443 Transcript_17682/m.35443 type:complete len:486 (+) Transcript_17682:219-1676(+)